MAKPLTDLTKDEEGIVVAIQGGAEMKRRLRLLGVAEGRRVRKLSGLAFGGPVVILVDRAQVAVGRGMAARILVNTDNAAPG